MRVLKLKAARGWSLSQVARAFAVTEETIASWLKRVDEEGERALVQLSEPVKKFPAYVRYLVRWLKSMCPTMGRLRIAQTLARAGLHLGASTVKQMLREKSDLKKPGEAALTEETVEVVAVSTRVLKARRPNHIWHVDLTLIPTTAGFWVPWQPFSKLLRWPFCWWVAVVIDHFSRRVCGLALFKKTPSSTELCTFLDRVTKRTGTKPKHTITDKGRQFICKTFRSWCRKHRVRPRYGAVGKQGSIAVIQRSIWSMKSECCRRILVPFRLGAI